MTIAATIDALQTIHAAISGVTKAPLAAAFPSQINGSNDLPIVLLWPGDADVTAAGRDLIAETGIYNGAVLVAAEASGTGIATSINQVWTLLAAFRTRYETLVSSSEKLSTGEVVQRYHDQGGGQQSGLITFRRATWLGFLFSVEVWEP